jgi:hypothetical protein
MRQLELVENGLMHALPPGHQLKDLRLDNVSSKVVDIFFPQFARECRLVPLEKDEPSAA